MHTIEHQDYDVIISDELSMLNPVIESIAPSSIAVLVDQNTETYCLPSLYESVQFDFNVIKIPSGESVKHIDTCSYIWDEMMRLRMDRYSLLINLGGGVIGDMGGFCASTFMRGMQFIQLPTTLLAQVDASIGGKVGIDHRKYKNLVGLFAIPKAVVVHSSFLESLPYSHVLSGMAEIIKHGLVYDSDYFEHIFEGNRLNAEQASTLVHRSIEIKSEIVSQDPFEKGVRKILNFGHTVGHAIESYLLESDDQLLHGEAIAIGMVCESYLSVKFGLLDVAVYQRIKKLLISAYGHKHKSLADEKTIAQFALNDKKNHAGQIRCTFLKAIGTASINNVINIDDIVESIQAYKSVDDVE